MHTALNTKTILCSMKCLKNTTRWRENRRERNKRIEITRGNFVDTVTDKVAICKTNVSPIDNRWRVPFQQLQIEESREQAANSCTKGEKVTPETESKSNERSQIPREVLLFVLFTLFKRRVLSSDLESPWSPRRKGSPV